MNRFFGDDDDYDPYDPMPGDRQKRSWFHNVFGTDEYYGMPCGNLGGTLWKIGENTFDVGTFHEIAPIEEEDAGIQLFEPGSEDIIRSFRMVKPTLGTPPNVRVHTIWTTDVMQLHGDPANHGALFQAASQFNYLEWGDPDSGNDGPTHLQETHKITNYINDHTQGPACAISTAPATYVRLMMQREYGTMYNGLIWAKEALENTFPPFWRWENGYALVDKIVDGVTAPEYQRDMEKCIKEKLRIGFLQNAQVVADGKPVESDGVQRLCHQRVSQVYCSAVALGYSGSAYNKNATGPFPTLVRAFAKAVLMASYRLTLQAAVYNAHHSTLPGRKKVFLTHVGGGVFGNERDAINDAICTAIEEVRNYDLDVYIVRFVHNNNFSLGNDEVEINERLARMHAADV